MRLRPITPSDDLMRFLVMAMDWRGEGTWDAERILADPQVAHYVTGWMRPGDGGVVAEADGEAVGAVWWRTFTAADEGYGYVADDVPELGFAVAHHHRGRGYGRALLEEAVARATALGLRGLSLSVEDGNRARRLYESVGFAAVGRTGNSDTCVLWLAASRT